MTWTFSSGRAIYLQICDAISYAVISGKYKMGEKIPSVREIALDASVNPNTVQRALSELESSGLICVQSTSGRFVTSEPEVIKEARRKFAEERVSALASSLGGIGYSRSEILSLIEDQLKGESDHGN